MSKNKNVTKWLVELAGDGAHDSFFVDGSLANVKCALVTEDADEFSPDLENEDNWDMYGVFYLDLEQGYVRIAPIRRGLK